MFGDLLDLDFSDVAAAGNWDWLDELVNLGSDVGDAGEWFVDSLTGEVVSAEDLGGGEVHRPRIAADQRQRAARGGGEERGELAQASLPDPRL